MSVGTLRIAWIGPRPQAGGGATGAARLVLDALLSRGHEVDCYLTGHSSELPDVLRDRDGLTIHWIGAPKRRRYDRDRTIAFLTGLAGRSLGFARLGRALAQDHRQDPYDVVLQFSRIELIGLRSRLDELPPIIVRPGVHAAGERRWLELEAELVRRCEPWYRRRPVRAVQGVRARIQRADLRRADAVICLSDGFRSELVADYGIDGARAHVVPNPVDLARFRPHPETERSGVVTVLFVSRMAVRKGVDQVVELSHRLADLEGSVRLLVVGGPSQWSDYTGLLDDLHQAMATFVGRWTFDELVRELPKADLLVAPSKYEPFGNTVAEALAAGVPVVTSDAVGASEGLPDGCCRRVPVGDTDALEAAVRAGLAQARSPEGEQARRLARSEAERRFGPARVAELTAIVLETARGPAGAQAGRGSAING